MPTPPPRSTRWFPLLYLAFGVAWILASDSVIGWLFRDAPRLLLIVGTVKGFAFVAFTSLILALWWRGEQRRHAALLSGVESRAGFAAERLSWMSRFASDAILLLDPAGRILDCNERAVAMYGRPRDTLLDMTVVDLCAPADRADAAAPFGQILARGSLTYVTRHVRSDGSELPVEISSWRVEFQGHHYVQSIVRDQTEQIAARRRLERQRDLYDMLSRCSQAVARHPDRQRLYEEIVSLAVQHGHFLFAWFAEPGPDGTVREAARYGADVGYLDVIEVSTLADHPGGRGPVGRTLREARTVLVNDFPNDPSAEHWREHARRAGIGACASVPVHMRDTVVGALAVYSTERNFFDPQIVATLEEIAEEVGFGLEAREVRKELDESRNLLQTVIDASATPIYAVDAEGGVLMVNTAGARIAGRPREQLIGRSRAEVWPAGLAAAHRESDARVFGSGETLFVQESIGGGADERVFLAVKFPLRDLQGRVYAVGGVSTEITDLRRAQREATEANTRLEQTVALRTQELTVARDRAEQADRAKTAFLSTISHELRTPLNSIIGFTDIVLQELSGPLNDDQRKQLAIVHESARLLLDLINEILDLSRIEAGRLQLNVEPFDLRDLLERRVQALKPQSDAKGLTLDCRIDPCVGIIRSDARRVAQIITNLVSNAVKFTAIGGVTLTARASGPAVTIEVRDTGPGIPAGDMANLFRPFMQGADAQRRHREGTGLGLVISRHLARALGGDIEATSEPGQGSAFVVTLPAASPPEPLPPRDTGLYRKLTSLP